MSGHVHDFYRTGDPRGQAKVTLCMCGRWKIKAGGFRADGHDALRELTAALERGAGHVSRKTAEEMRGIARSVRASGTGWR